MGLTAILGTGDGTGRIADGDSITLSCCEGDVGHVYRGAVPFRVEEQAIDDLPAAPLFCGVDQTVWTKKVSQIRYNILGEVVLQDVVVDGQAV